MLDKIRSQLVNNAAQILRSPVHFLPNKLQNMILLEGMKAVFKEALEDGDFEFLQEKWLKIHIRDLNLSWFISYDDEQLIVADTPKQQDVSFSGDLNDLVLIAGRKEDPDTLFFQRRLSIEGDTELGLEVKNLMDSVDLDALPKPMFNALMRLAEFVHQGLQPSPNLSKGTSNAY
ncbi:ubiquinone anaerobic biosynthesis accessory factor UbiT [Vibrio hippocampi]|uniref:Ubiquinone biosynthesis accessory factor UbiT n=1 Tax=Vibrio hippocampi TaxID=654686 RepID=A0ABM8ZIV3_9VIBR|nr:SCP2 domain-containing protein [Vibrio hippocampi]CAH0526761.1 Ubiquinone biosynthesis accessory factor UbiJ [Vibrio hippocampi]